MVEHRMREQRRAPFLERVLAIVRPGMDRYWGSFARFAAHGRGGIVAGGDMA